MRKLQFTVESESISVKDYLKRHLNISSRSIIGLKGIENGITLNGLKTRTVDMMKRGDLLSVLVDDPEFIDEGKIPFKVLFQDENYIVLDKPPFTTVYKSGKEEKNVNDILTSKYPTFAFRPFYRLDKNTSGTLLLAKNGLVMQGTKVNKEYFALCHGKVPEKGIINEAISLEENSVIKRRCGYGGLSAVTEYERIDFDGENSFVKMILHTGRTHQIRVHFSFLGHPLLGDELYGGKQELINRQALHCGTCKIGNKALSFEKKVVSQFPDDFISAFKNKIE